MVKPHTPHVPALVVRHLTLVELALPIHPQQIGKRVARQDPLVVTHRLDLHVLDRLHAPFLEEVGQAGKEGIGLVDVDSGGVQYRMDWTIRKAPTPDPHAQRPCGTVS